MRLLFLFNLMVCVAKLFNTSLRKSTTQCIVSAKQNYIHCNHNATQFMLNNNLTANKKLITISPGGFKGFYLLGSLTYIKEHYDTSNIIYSGASAGAWNGLFMCYKGDPIKFAYNVLTDDRIKQVKSLNELQYIAKYKLLSEYKDNDFDLKKLFIGVTTFKMFNFFTNIISDFDGLEDAINCCIASSHIPLITGGLTNKYKNMFTFDGGFSDYPYLNNIDNILHVTPEMWDDLEPNDEPKNVFIKIRKYYKRFAELNYFQRSALELFDDGYQDAKHNKPTLNIIFNKNTHVYHDDSEI